MRTAFIQQLIEKARTDSRIFLIVGDLGFSVVEPFAKEFPNQFLNAGVAEQNMMGLAAGLAMDGYNVFTYSIGNFPTLRCIEQIRYDVCYHNLNVKIVAVGGGYAYGPLGASHHATEEIGMLRVIPNLAVCAPGDPVETKVVTSIACDTYGPCYIRLGKAGEPVVHQQELNFKRGESIQVLTGKNVAVLTTGAMLKATADYIKTKNLAHSLYSFPFIKPLDVAALREIALTYDKVICVEEHQKNAGFGSSVLEGFNDLIEQGQIPKMPVVKRIGINDQFLSIAGSQEHLRIVGGIHLTALDNA